MFAIHKKGEKTRTKRGIPRCNACITCRSAQILLNVSMSTPMIKHHFISLLRQYFFHASNMTSFLDVQTSVAVISPSKAKSVCSLSVCFHKQTKTVPSGKQENDKNPTCKPVKMHFSFVNRDSS